MKSLKQLFAVALCVFYPVVGYGQVNQLTEKLIIANEEKQLMPVLSIDNPSLTVDVAYQIQKNYVEQQLKTDGIAGFKAGLTAEAGQKKFMVDEAVAGVLFESGRRSDNAVINSEQFHRPMLETEIGFIIDLPLKEKISDIAVLKKAIRAVVPVIEIPDLSFADLKHLKGVDIIAANVVAKQYIVGEPKAVGAESLNTIRVKLSHDNRVINEGKGGDALGDQWQALLWLVNQRIDQGWYPKPGQLLITGALGKMLPAKPGKYLADYGNFGKITFKVE